MEILLRYDNKNRKDLLMSSKPENTIDTLMKYLTLLDIPFVKKLPEQRGIYCTIDDDGSYDISQIIFNKEDNRYEESYLYSLKWLRYSIDEVSLRIGESFKASE
jgi:hypothetical protein